MSKESNKMKFYPEVFAESARRRSGFSLVETLVAIAILAVAIAGPMTLAEKSITAARYSKDEITAYYLAQDAIEYVRNVRDRGFIQYPGGNWLDPNADPNNNLSACSSSDCAVDSVNSAVVPCASWNNYCQLYFTPGWFFLPFAYYTIYPGSYQAKITPFVRKVRVVETVPGVEAKVTVTVSWMTGLFSNTITMNDYLYNWLVHAP